MVSFDDAKKIAFDNRSGMIPPSSWEEYEKGFVFSMEVAAGTVGGFDSPFVVMKDDGSVVYGAIPLIMCGDLGCMVSSGKF